MRRLFHNDTTLLASLLMDLQEQAIPSFSSKEERIRWFEEESATMAMNKHTKNFDEMAKIILAEEYLLILRCMLTFHLQSLCVPHSNMLHCRPC